MKEDPGITDTLFKRVTEYGITYIELVKLRTIHKIIKVISAVFPDFIVAAFFGVFLKKPSPTISLGNFSDNITGNV